MVPNLRRRPPGPSMRRCNFDGNVHGSQGYTTLEARRTPRTRPFRQHSASTAPIKDSDRSGGHPRGHRWACAPHTSSATRTGMWALRGVAVGLQAWDPVSRTLNRPRTNGYCAMVLEVLSCTYGARAEGLRGGSPSSLLWGYSPVRANLVAVAGTGATVRARGRSWGVTGSISMNAWPCCKILTPTTLADVQRRPQHY